jgi:uncharacterized protein YndB with AHSA1/START domain
MNKQLIVQNSILIHAPAEKVWDALTSPEQTKKYMFGCEAISEWRPGSALVWKGHFDGHELIAVKGSILDIKPGRFLAYTTIDPNSAMEDIPQNYLTVTYSLEDTKVGTRLTVTQGDYATVADGERRYQEANNNGEGWTPILVQIKALVESD